MNLKTLNINISTTENTSDGSKSLAIFLVNILSMIRLIHWYTNNINIHKILDDLYHDLNENFDSLQEEIIGVVKDQKICFNISPPILDINNCLLYSDSQEKTLNEIYDIFDLINKVLSSLEFKSFIDNNISGINNTRESIITTCNKYKYLLGMVCIDYNS